MSYQQPYGEIEDNSQILRASYLTREFRCYEAKIEESEKASSRQLPLFSPHKSKFPYNSQIILNTKHIDSESKTAKKHFRIIVTVLLYIVRRRKVQSIEEKTTIKIFNNTDHQA